MTNLSKSQKNGLYNSAYSAYAFAIDVVTDATAAGGDRFECFLLSYCRNKIS